MTNYNQSVIIIKNIIGGAFVLKIYKTTCSHCGKAYAYENRGDVYAGGKDREDITCPYCNKVDLTKMTSGYFSSYKLDKNGHPILITK